MPKKLHMKCLTKYKDKIEACTSEAIPTLIQIQDYVRNLRRKLGDTNNIEDIKKYVEEHGYHPELTIKINESLNQRL